MSTSNNIPINQLTALIRQWAIDTTSVTSPRWRDLLREKERHVQDFFDYVGKSAEAIHEEDVIHWQTNLMQRGLMPATIYTRLSHLSSFCDVLIQRDILKQNPVQNVERPDLTQSPTQPVRFDDEHVGLLLEWIKQKADAGDISAKRDYALLLIFLYSNLGRAEILNLRWEDVQNRKGYLIEAIRNSYEFIRTDTWQKYKEFEQALLAYLSASGRLDQMIPHSPLWTRHDRAGQPGPSLSSQGFGHSLKQHLIEAGLPYIRLQEIRAAGSGKTTDYFRTMSHRPRGRE